MLNNRLAAAKSVATDLFEAERDIDTAVASTAGLLVSAVNARGQANLPAVIGQPALERLGVVITTLLDGRREIIAAHEGFAQAQRDMGLGERAWGDVFPKPEPSGSSEPDVPAVAVAA